MRQSSSQLHSVRLELASGSAGSSMNVTLRGPRSRWVGPPLSAPKGGRGRSPGGRQRHYGAVELAGAGAQVNVNDVVEFGEISQQGTTSQQRPLLAQVRCCVAPSDLGKQS